MSRHLKWIRMDHYKRQVYVKYVIKKLLLSTLKKTKKSTVTRRYLSYIYLVRLTRVSSKTFFNRRCLMSGRVWSVNKKTGLSRFELRKEIYKSNVPGFRRASW